MNLKMATLIAVIAVLLNGFLYLSNILRWINWYHSFQLFAILSVLSLNGSLAMFFIVLYTKQNTR